MGELAMDLAIARAGPGRLATLEEGVAPLAHAGLIIVVDDHRRENEGDRGIAADRGTAAAINFMAGRARGLVCVPMLEHRLSELDIPAMAVRNPEPMRTAFRITVDLRSSGSRRAG